MSSRQNNRNALLTFCIEMCADITTEFPRARPEGVNGMQKESRIEQGQPDLIRERTPIDGQSRLEVGLGSVASDLAGELLLAREAQATGSGIHPRASSTLDSECSTKPRDG